MLSRAAPYRRLALSQDRLVTRDIRVVLFKGSWSCEGIRSRVIRLWCSCVNIQMHFFEKQRKALSLGNRGGLVRGKPLAQSTDMLSIQMVNVCTWPANC